jgi:hypothetical protein
MCCRLSARLIYIGLKKYASFLFLHISSPTYHYCPDITHEISGSNPTRLSSRHERLFIVRNGLSIKNIANDFMTHGILLDLLPT